MTAIDRYEHAPYESQEALIHRRRIEDASHACTIAKKAVEAALDGEDVEVDLWANDRGGVLVNLYFDVENIRTANELLREVEQQLQRVVQKLP